MEEPLSSTVTSSPFVSFVGKEEVLAQLRSIDGYGAEAEPLYRLIVERLAEKAYDRSAFAFILIELVYEFEEVSGGDWEDLLARMVLVLTQDEELAGDTLQAYGEIKASLEPQEPQEPPAEPEAAPPPETSTDTPFPLGPFVARRRGPEQERLMIELQEVQKEIVDLGLSVRMSIDMTLSRPSRDGVNYTLREVSALHSRLRDFEGLLRESEERILEAIGVLEREED